MQASFVAHAGLLLFSVVVWGVGQKDVAPRVHVPASTLTTCSEVAVAVTLQRWISISNMLATCSEGFLWALSACSMACGRAYA